MVDSGDALVCDGGDLVGKVYCDEVLCELRRGSVFVLCGLKVLEGECDYCDVYVDYDLE